jgi:methylenetetrahydrofolate dehydrogenase (NADP+)/methenyltetrahydrofolate cyclohydrolase
MMLLKEILGAQLSGLDALVIGRSNLVGKPMAQLLLQESCTVTAAHSQTRDLARLSARADILVASVGRTELVRGNWIKPGATVIDVGTNRKQMADGKNKLVGDVAFDEALSVAGAITPVPGGVGPMTIACLMRNTLIAAALQTGLPQPDI